MAGLVFRALGVQMLVLSRQLNDSIMIGDDIEITIVEVKGDKVRLGIRAPADVAVHRKELYDQIRAENLRAAENSPTDLADVKELLRKSPNTDVEGTGDR